MAIFFVLLVYIVKANFRSIVKYLRIVYRNLLSYEFYTVVVVKGIMVGRVPSSKFEKLDKFDDSAIVYTIKKQLQLPITSLSAVINDELVSLADSLDGFRVIFKKDARGK